MRRAAKTHDVHVYGYTVGAHTPATRPEKETAARRDKDRNSVRRRYGAAAVGERERFIFHFATGRAESESPVSPPAIFLH